MTYSSDSPNSSIASVRPALALPSAPPAPLAGYDDWVDVEVHADPGLDVIALVLDGSQQLMWHQDTARVALALDSAVDTAQWCSRRSMLLVPGGFDGPAGSSFFSLTAAERPHQCRKNPATVEPALPVPRAASLQ